MVRSDSTHGDKVALRWYVGGLVFAWTLVIVGLLIWESIEHYDNAWAIAQAETDLPFQMAPLYMLRELHELGHEERGQRTHIASLRPLRPENAPDAWEAAALRAFENGSREVSDVETIDGAPYLRRMQPLIATASCMNCHRAENFKVGDIRGGISISVAISELQEAARTETLHTAIFYSVLWAAGVCGIVLTGRRLASQVRRVRQAEEELCRAYAGLETTVQRRTAELHKQIEKRREADDALRDSEARHRRLFVNSSDAMMTAAPPAWKFTSCNPAALRMFNIQDEAEFTSFGPWQLSPEVQPDGQPSAEMAKEMIETAVREGSHFFEWTFQHANGEAFPTTVFLIRIELAGQTLLQGTVRDISVQKRAEQTQRELIAILEATPDFVGSVSGKDKHIRYINKAGRAMIGIGKDEDVTRLHVFDVHPEWTNKILSDEALATAATDGVWEGECAFLSRDGREIPILMVLLAHKAPSGEVEVFSTISRDISERKRVEAELIGARTAAEAANWAKSEFLANMSHEIRSPMTAILGYADLLMDDALDAADRKTFLAIVRRNGEHLLQLINDILDLSKIEAGKMVMDFGPCHLSSMVADVASTLRPRAEQRGSSLEVRYTGALPETIHTDGARLRQVLVNLVGNAVKFTENGNIRIGVSFLPQWWSDQPAVRVEVTDTGIGIRQESLPHLFQPFTQADNSTTREYGGTGLGLAISRQIVAALGGELTVESVHGEGSTFTVTIPTGDMAGVKLLESPGEVICGDKAGTRWTPGAGVLRGVRILLAEDSIDNQELLRTVLGKVGAEVQVVENGRLAIERAEADTFDVVLMDINMPEMDGYEATRRLRDGGYQRPILALTANAMTGDCEQCLAAGCDAYLAKPIDRQQLIETVAHYARSKTSQTDAPAANQSRAVTPGRSDGIASRFADDPQLAEILPGFVERLPSQLDALCEALEEESFEDVERLAHRIKGAGGSYGYPTLSEAAKSLELAAKTQDMGGAAAALAEVKEVCDAIQAGWTSHTAEAGRS